jgi:hypothetical protein
VEGETSTIAGPTVEFAERTGSDYNDIAARAVVGNLENAFGYTSEIYGLAAGDANGEQITATKDGVAVDGTLTAQAGGVAEQWTVGDSIYMWDSGATGNPSSVDEVRISQNGDGDGSSNYVRIFYGATDSWGIEGTSNKNKVFHLGDHNVIAGWEMEKRYLRSEPTQGGGGIEIAAGAPRQSGQTQAWSYLCTHNADKSTFASLYYADDSSFGLVVKDAGTKKVHFGDEMMIEGDLLVDGSVTANEIDVDDVLATNATVSGTLTMGTDGEITNAQNDFSIDENGFTLKGNDVFTSERAITFLDINGDKQGQIWYDYDDLKLEANGVRMIGHGSSFSMTSAGPRLSTEDSVQISTEAGTGPSFGRIQLADELGLSFNGERGTKFLWNLDDDFEDNQHVFSRSGEHAHLSWFDENGFTIKSSQSTGSPGDVPSFSQSLQVDDISASFGPIQVLNDYYNVADQPPSPEENKSVTLALTNRGSGVELVAKFRDSTGNISTKRIALA